MSIFPVEAPRSPNTTTDDADGRFTDDGGPSPAEHPDRLRLVWAPKSGQRIRGVWWPRSRDITVELGKLLPAADAYLRAPLTRLSLNPTTWDHQPRRLYTGRRVIRLAWFSSIDPAIVGIGASPLQRVTVAVIPPECGEATGRRIFYALRDGPWPDEPSQLI